MAIWELTHVVLVSLLYLQFCTDAFLCVLLFRIVCYTSWLKRWSVIERVIIAVAAPYLLNSVLLVLSTLITDCVCVCYLVSSVSFWAMECVIFTLYHILCFKMHTDNLFNFVTIKPLTQACQNCIKLVNVSIAILLNDVISCVVLSNQDKAKGQTKHKCVLVIIMFVGPCYPRYDMLLTLYNE
jgi:hypothetical protein